MSLQVHHPADGAASIVPAPGPSDDDLAYARQILRGEAAALELVAQRLAEPFLQAVELLLHGPGRIVLTGTGKSADVAQKIAGTLNSTGTRAYILDATRAVHGDLGMVHHEDVALVLSHSGESEEVVRLLGPLRHCARAVIGLTGNEHSTLARRADVPLVYGPIDEVCPLGLAPSTSTTVMMALGDALAFTLSRRREFTAEDFAKYHPAGSLGRKLLKVDAVMRTGHELRLAPASATVREVFGQARRRGRRTGAVMLTDDDGKLSGLFTDSDLARLFEQRRDAALDQPIREVMTPQPLTITHGGRVGEALDIFRRCKISELPVVDEDGRPVGLLDITDLIAGATADQSEAA
jgi:arabinose-5-phosphate isomerase